MEPPRIRDRIDRVARADRVEAAKQGTVEGGQRDPRDQRLRLLPSSPPAASRRLPSRLFTRRFRWWLPFRPVPCELSARWLNSHEPVSAVVRVVCFSCCSDLFNLRYSAKSLATEAKKSEKNAASNKIKCKKAMEVRTELRVLHRSDRIPQRSAHSPASPCVSACAAREHGGRANLRGVGHSRQKHSTQLLVAHETASDKARA